MQRKRLARRQDESTRWTRFARIPYEYCTRTVVRGEMREPRRGRPAVRRCARTHNSVCVAPPAVICRRRVVSVRAIPLPPNERAGIPRRAYVPTTTILRSDNIVRLVRRRRRLLL